MKHRGRFVLSIFIVLATFYSFPIFAQDKPSVVLGGALRFNYNYSDWKPDNRKRGGDFGYDVFFLNAKASYKKLTLTAEYRFYPSSSGGGMLKYGWIGYQFNDMHQLQLGLTLVPFGIQPYTGNSYFYNLNFFLGLEDNYKMGLKYLFRKGPWEMNAAFYKNADVLDFSANSETSPNRFSYDVGGRNKEVNQGNAQVIYHWGNEWTQQIGASAKVGGLYNIDTQKVGLNTAFAAHYGIGYKRWNFKAQYTTYTMNPVDKDGEDRNKVTMVAYGASYNIAARADIYLATLSYTIPFNKGILNDICFYNDFSIMHKRVKGYNESYQNVTGCLIGIGPIYTYVDYALGKNQAWLGKDWNNAFAEGQDSNQWNARFNINIGYYF